MTQFMLPYDLLVSLCAPKIAPNFFTTFPLSPCNRYGHLYPNQADGSDRKDDRRNLIGNRFTKIRKAFDLTREWFAQKGGCSALLQFGKTDPPEKYGGVTRASSIKTYRRHNK